MNVMVIAPHPDDETIGCGGAICLHVSRRDNVSAVFLSSGEGALTHLSHEEAWRVREREAEAACGVLGVSGLTFLRQPDWSVGANIDAVVGTLVPVLEHSQPDLLYLPHPDEWHPDHQASLPIVRRALQQCDRCAAGLLMYEVWTPLSVFDHVEDITSVIRRKLEALRCHKSQLAQFRYDRAVRGLAQYRGALAARTGYAEVFKTTSVTAETATHE